MMDERVADTVEGLLRFNRIFFYIGRRSKVFLHTLMGFEYCNSEG
jgi:hypothetical protein